MSLHYEWTLSLRLRSDTPEPFLAELRFHLGLAEHEPQEPTLGIDWPCLVPAQDDHLPGGPVRSLAMQRPYLSLHPWLNFFVQDGHAYAAEPGGGVEALNQPAPPFTLHHTSDTP